MLTAIVTILLTFLFTGFVSNWLIQKWQQRNWVNQQRFLGEQKEYDNLKALSEEIIQISGRRFSRMRRLLSVLRRPDDNLVRQRLQSYDETLSEWNEKLNSFLARLTFYAAYEMARRLDEDIQKRFVAAGNELENLTKLRLSGGMPKDAQISHLVNELNNFYGGLLTYNRQLLREVEIQRAKTYYGKRIELSRETLKHFPTWELVKGLFKPRVSPPSIVRPPTDLRAPFGSGE